MTKLDARLATESQRLAAASDEQKAEVARLRAELEKAVAESAASVTGELDTHARRAPPGAAGGRRQARPSASSALGERISREESEAARAASRPPSPTSSAARPRSSSASCDRAAERFAEAAAVQFETTVKAAREDAARRLGRELDRAVQQFAREAETVLAEQLAHAGDAGASRLEKKLARITATLERQRDEFLGALERRLLDVEQDVKQRLASARRPKERRSARCSKAASPSSAAGSRRPRPRLKTG